MGVGASVGWGVCVGVVAGWGLGVGCGVEMRVGIGVLAGVGVTVGVAVGAVPESNLLADRAEEDNNMIIMAAEITTIAGSIAFLFTIPPKQAIEL